MYFYTVLYFCYYYNDDDINLSLLVSPFSRSFERTLLCNIFFFLGALTFEDFIKVSNNTSRNWNM